jgi:hypothetical protein
MPEERKATAAGRRRGAQRRGGGEARGGWDGGREGREGRMDRVWLGAGFVSR